LSPRSTARTAHDRFPGCMNQRLRADPYPSARTGRGPEQTVSSSGSAATPAGCWCRCCATSAWRRASSRGT
jgi:hypothetical protein